MIDVVALQDGKVTRVVLQMICPVGENGLPRRLTGKTGKRLCVDELDVSHRGSLVFSAQFGVDMADNSILEFHIKGIPVGDELLVEWRDSEGRGGVSSPRVVSKSNAGRLP